MFCACAYALLGLRRVVGASDFLGAKPFGCPLERHSVACVYLCCGPSVEERRRESDRGKKSAYNAEYQERGARGAFRACAYALLGSRRVAAKVSSPAQ